MKMKKLCIIFCGGTIAMARKENGQLAPHYGAEAFLQKFPQLEAIAEIELIDLFNLDSTNVQPHHWISIIETIIDRYEEFDGFVVTHGTDTMVYSASAVAFALQGLQKPVVFTGAQKPVDEIASDAHNNLINACRVALMDLSEVSIVFGSYILRGCRAKKKSEVMLDAFFSPVSLPIGRIHLEPNLINYYKKRGKGKPNAVIGFNNNVIVYEITPGLKPQFLMNDLANGVEGVILSAPGAGNVPHVENSLIPYIQRATAQNIPVVVTTQCLEGSAQMEIYEAGAVALAAGAISAFDMTHEAATVKLMWALTQSKSLPTIKQLMQKDIAGEITVRGEA